MNAEILLSKFLSQLNNPDQNKELELFDYLFSISSKIKREHRNPIQGCVSYLREIIQMLENNEIKNLNNDLITQLQDSLYNQNNPILVLHILELVYLCRQLKIELFFITIEQFKQLLMNNKNDGKIQSLILLLNFNENWILADLIPILHCFIQINHIDLRVLINALITVMYQSQSIDIIIIITHCEVILNYCYTMEYDQEILKVLQIIHKYQDIILQNEYINNFIENQMSDLSLLPLKFQIWKQAAQIVYENDKLLISSKQYILIALHTSQPHFDISMTLFIRFVEIQEINPQIKDKHYVRRITLYLEELMNPNQIGQVDHTNWISIYNCLTALLLYTDYNLKSYIIPELVYVSDDRQLQLSLFIFIRILNHLHSNLIDFNSLELRNHIAKWSLTEGDIGDIANSLQENWNESQK